LLLVAFVSVFVSVAAIAELTVIHDTGHTKPIAPLLKPFVSDQGLSDHPGTAADSTDQKVLDGATLSNLLPVRSPGLLVGDLAGRQLELDVRARLAQGNPRPFFLIGSDRVSLDWLATHRDTLKSLGAVGMLVQAETEQDVRHVAEISQGLSITLGSGSDVAGALGIDRYPVLITRDGITQ
jgi:integrating conjugative element protein (TIGR03765 family)